MKSEIVNTIERIKTGVPRDELISLIDHENQSVRGSAIQSLAERFAVEPATVEVFRTFILKSENRKPAMGTISLSHLAMKLLSAMHCSGASEAFAELRRSWPENDRADLTWFLENG